MFQFNLQMGGLYGRLLKCFFRFELKVIFLLFFKCIWLFNLHVCLCITLLWDILLYAMDVYSSHWLIIKSV